MTGAGVAKTARGSCSAETKLDGGFTVRPWAMDQSIRLVKRYLDCSSFSAGGYCGYMGVVMVEKSWREDRSE